jgi:hypothetical protein
MRVMGVGRVLASAMTWVGARLSHGMSQAVPITSSLQGARVSWTASQSAHTARRDRLALAVSRRLDRPRQLSAGRVVMDRNVSPWLLASLFFYVAPRLSTCRTARRTGLSSDTLRVVLSAGLSAEPHPHESPLNPSPRRRPDGLLGSAQAIEYPARAPFFVTQFAGARWL